MNAAEDMVEIKARVEVVAQSSWVNYDDLANYILIVMCSVYIWRSNNAMHMSVFLNHILVPLEYTFSKGHQTLN